MQGLKHRGSKDMNYMKEYKKKIKTPEEAVKIVQDGDWVDYCAGAAFPELLDAALAARKGDLHDVNVRGNLEVKPVKVAEQDPENISFTYNTWHCSGYGRHYIDRGGAFFSPMLFRNCGSYYTRGLANVDVVMITAAPMDKNGNFSFGLNNCATQEIIDKAAHVILEVNPNMPVIYGLACDHIHISEVDSIVESNVPVGGVPNSTATDIDKKIAAYIFPYLQNGMTLQLGIGGTPNALGDLIARSELKDLGMHAEFMSDGYLSLYQAGKITNQKKELQRGKGVFSTCAGSRELYDYMDHNMDIMSAPMSYVNDPYVIGQFKNFVSINGCIAVDLYGQVCSESAGMRQISGTGGQLDFVTGTYLSEHGQAFLAMSSAFFDAKGHIHSRILPRFTAGDIITTPRTQAPCIVTEYGIASLTGKTTWQRAEALISIAHPAFRETLIDAAAKQKIWRRSNHR